LIEKAVLVDTSKQNSIDLGAFHKCQPTNSLRELDWPLPRQFGAFRLKQQGDDHPAVPTQLGECVRQAKLSCQSEATASRMKSAGIVSQATGKAFFQAQVTKDSNRRVPLADSWCLHPSRQQFAVIDVFCQTQPPRVGKKVNKLMDKKCHYYLIEK
jgi:hypothetical protein